MKNALIIKKEYPFSKVGINEIKGLPEMLRELGEPILENVKSKIYWNDSLDFESSEYTSRDGFIPYGHNCGGMELSLVIPNCESYDFSFLEFGECDDEECDHESECGYESDGHLDAKLRVWLKFEGINAQGEMEFYFYMGGGNGDAPYFRTKDESTYFEESFSCKSLAGLKRKGNAVIKRMLKAME